MNRDLGLVLIGMALAIVLLWFVELCDQGKAWLRELDNLAGNLCQTETEMRTLADKLDPPEARP